MHVKRIDHLAIAVKDVNQATEIFVKLLNAHHIRTTILVEKAGTVKISYVQIGENILSLIQSVEKEGFVSKFIEKRGEGIHHLGLEVDNLDEFINSAEFQGFEIPLMDEFSNRREVVLRPKETNGVVLQIMEWKGGSDLSIEDRIRRIQELKNI